MEPNHEKILKTGVNAETVKQGSKNKKLIEDWVKVIDASKVQLPCDKKIGNLLQKLAQSLDSHTSPHLDLLAQYIGSEKFARIEQLDTAISFVKTLAKGEALDVSALEKACGVGVVVTAAQIAEVVKAVLQKHDADLTRLRWAINKNLLMKEVRDQLKFAEGKLVSDTFNELLKARLGDETAEDKKLRDEALREKSKADSKKAKETSAERSAEEEFGAAPKIKLTDLIARDLDSALNTVETKKWHEDTYQGKIQTRFPPEPNGYLHIGHAKSMRFQFRVAQEYHGNCYLRFDDTNPEAECQEYIDNIKENVSWLGYKPWRVTHASDIFDKLYEFAVELIKKGKAYVCHQTKQQMSESREKCTPSPWRNRSVEENLKLFEQMKMGFFEEGKAMLRAKIDYKHPNTTLRDPVMYRIRYTPHPHVGDKWCIYPLYDYTHGINDSLEGITHSVCTLEFEIRRELYYWYLEQLNIYRPFVWEFSRLNLSNNVVSKRKLRYLVEHNYVRGWDDPRLLTINGMRRRGYTPAGINEFCDLCSVTRSGNENIIDFGYLEHVIRRELDHTAVRSLAVIDPVVVHLTNLSDDFVKVIEAPDFPHKRDESTKHKIILTNKVYIEREDVRKEGHPDFFGLTTGQAVGLKYACVIHAKEIRTNEQGVVTEVFAEAEIDFKEKPKAFVNWVSASESVSCEVRLYDILFTARDPNALEDWLSAYNKESLAVRSNSRMNKNLVGAKHLTTFQFERQGFFTVDYDTQADKGIYIWNRVVKLADTERQKAIKRIQEAK